MGALVLSHDDVVVAPSPRECAEVMAKVLAAHARGEAHMPLRSIMMAPGAAGMMGLMPPWRGGRESVFALKAICVMPGNPAQGLDAHQGIVILFDGETGVPAAILNASAITAVRTAAVSAVATRLLARADARALAILGLTQGEDHVRAELGEVLVGRAPGRLNDEELTVFRSLGLAVEDLAAAEHAVARARSRGLGAEVEL